MSILSSRLLNTCFSPTTTNGLTLQFESRISTLYIKPKLGCSNNLSETTLPSMTLPSILDVENTIFAIRPAKPSAAIPVAIYPNFLTSISDKPPSCKFVTTNKKYIIY